MQSTIIGRVAWAVMTLALLSGCSRKPELTPRLILHGELVGDEFWLDAPYVAAVRVVHADMQGRPEPIFPGGSRSLQLVRFEANVENMIKGDLPDKTIVFYFFAKMDQNPRYLLDPGRRYIVSLRSEGGVLRSWADATQLRIEVYSGSHRQQDLPLDQGPEVTITYILLTPGVDCDLEEFTNRFIGWPRYGQPGYVSERLEQLQRHPNRKLREAACLTAASVFWYRPGCLEQAAESPDSSTRKAARGLQNDDVNLPARLRNNPFYLFPRPWTDYMFEWLEIFAEDTRPEVRQEACASLRNFAPHRVVARCR